MTAGLGEPVSAAVRVLDSHVHVWDLAQRPQPWIDPVTMPMLNRDHPVAELARELSGSEVSSAILVQVLNIPDETDDYLWLGAEACIAGVVGWVDLLAPDLPDRLAALAEHPSGTRLLGIRHQALAERDPAGWLARVGELAAIDHLGEHGLPLDLMLLPEHLTTSYDVVAANRGTTFVLDHCGKPPVRSGWSSDPSRRWADMVTRLAELPNLTCKLSGLTTMADPAGWTEDDLRPYVDHVLERFGPHRVMFGSDWPVSLRAGSYARTVAAVRRLMSELSPTERSDVLADTASRVYRLASTS